MFGTRAGIVFSVLVSTFGSRRVTMVGAVLASAGFSLSSLAFNIYWMHLTFGLLVGKL